MVNEGNTDMHVKYKGLIRERMGSGTFRYRVRVAGQRAKKITIPVGPDHHQFRELYDAARVGAQVYLETAPVQRRNAYTVRWLCDIYLEALEQQANMGNASPLTLVQRRSFANQLCAEQSESENAAGELFANLHAEIPTSELVKMRDRMMGKPGACSNMFKFLRSMFSWAVDREYLETNPAAGIKVAYKSKGGAVPWSTDDLAKYRKTHALGTPAHLCLSLFMFTACRIGDVYQLGRANEVMEDGIRSMSWTPGKKGSSDVIVPILPPLQAAIDAVKVVGPTYILSTHGRPYTTMDSMRTRFARWCSEAGLEGRTAHGIRKAAGHLLSLHGATQYEIMAVHGHANASTSEVYTRGVERQRLAASAVHKLRGLKW